jgi:hypothetical protein
MFLYLNGKDWTAPVIHNDPVTTFRAEGIIYTRRANYLRMPRTIRRHTTLLSNITISHLDESDGPMLRVLKNSHSRQFGNLETQHKYQKPRYIDDYLRNSGLPEVISDEC